MQRVLLQCRLRLIRDLLHDVVHLVVLPVGDQLRLRLVERLQMGIFVRKHLDDVIAVFGLDNAAGLARLAAKSSPFELGQHLPVFDPVPDRRPWRPNRCPREYFFARSSKLAPALDLLQQVVGLRFDLGVFGRRFAVGLQQNVLGVYPLLSAKLLLVLVVHLQQVGIGRDQRFGDLRLVGDQNRQILRFRHVVIGLVHLERTSPNPWRSGCVSALYLSPDTFTYWILIFSLLSW